MREILYRGQDAATGDWIKGFYVHLFDDKGNDSHRIYSGYAETDCEDYYPDFWEVDPETVGQFTGLTDKNGKKIFEGDIVEVNHDAYPGARGEVFLRNGSFMLEKVSDVLSLYGFLPWCKVIGNIHDNPELLNEK